MSAPGRSGRTGGAVPVPVRSNPRYLPRLSRECRNRADGRYRVPAAPDAAARAGLPAGNAPGKGAGLRGVGDDWEQPAQLDRG